VLRTLGLVMACTACLGAVAVVHLHDPGIRKHGRLLLDESHSRWERTDDVYDTDWYGHESGYNYYCIGQYLRHFYDLDFHMEGALTPELLARYDVLILKTPTEPYSDAEMNAVEAFVRRGGGLFALGEHTNVFGSSVFLNPIIRRFGLAFRYDSVFDITRKWEQVYFPPELGNHPVVQWMDFDRFAVSCSVSSKWWNTHSVIRGTGLWTLPIDYTAANFYPHVEDRADAKFGAFDQMVASTADKGRVVAFGDSTVYSNFLAFYPGKAEKLLGTMEWLNRTNRWNHIRWIGAVVFTVALLCAVGASLVLTPNLGYAATVAVSAAATTWLGIWGCSILAREAYPPPRPHTPVQRVVFEMQHSSYELPVFSFTQKYPESFEIFYQWVLRLGYFTDVTFNLDRSLGRSEPIVLIRSKRPFLEQTRLAARQYLEQGGSLLVLDSPGNSDSTSNELLSEFGVSFSDRFARGQSILEPTSGVRICGLRGGRIVEGGTPLLTTENKEVLASFVNIGKGRLIAAGLADRFADTQMGGSSRIVPDREMRAVYELEFSLMRGLVEGEVEKQIESLGKLYGSP